MKIINNTGLDMDPTYHQCPMWFWALEHYPLVATIHLLSYSFNSPPIKSISSSERRMLWRTILHNWSYPVPQIKALSAEDHWWNGTVCVGLCSALALTDLLEDSFQCWNWPWQLSSYHFTPFEGCRVQVLYLCFLESCMKMTILCFKRCASHQQS